MEKSSSETFHLMADQSSETFEFSGARFVDGYFNPFSMNTEYIEHWAQIHSFHLIAQSVFVFLSLSLSLFWIFNRFMVQRRR